MGECSELSVMVGACVDVDVVKLLKKWLLCGGHVAGSAVTDPGWQVPGWPVERLKRQATMNGRRLYVLCI